MKPDKFAEFLHAHARLLHRAGANPPADAIGQVAAYFADAKGASVKTALKGAKPAGQRNPATAPVADLIADLQATAAAISAKAPAIADLSLLRDALTGPGTTLAEVIAGWSSPVAKPVRKTPATRKAAPLRRQDCAKTSSPPTPPKSRPPHWKLPLQRSKDWSRTRKCASPSCALSPNAWEARPRPNRPRNRTCSAKSASR